MSNISQGNFVLIDRFLFFKFQEYEVGSKDGQLPLDLTMDALYIINKALVSDDQYEYIFRVSYIYER